MDKSPFFLLPLPLPLPPSLGDNWKFWGILQIFSICFSSSLENVQCCAVFFFIFYKLKHIFGTKWNGDADFGAQGFKCYTTRSETVALHLFGLFGRDVEVQHVCEVVWLYEQKREWVLLSVRECGEMQGETSSLLAEWSTAEKRGLEKSTPDCWLFLCTIPRQCALHGRQQAIHWSSQYPSLNISSFSPVLPPPPLHPHPYIFLSSLISVSVHLS